MKRLSLLILLAACATTEPPAPSLPPQTEDTCGAASRANLIGQDVTVLEKVLILGMVRVIRPGDVVTMDFRPTRINFLISETDRVRAIKCG